VVEAPTPKPEPEEPEPEHEPEAEEMAEEAAFLQEPGVVVFNAQNMDGGLSLRLNEDVDVEVVTASENQETAWRTGNGEVLPDVDGNGEGDYFIMFDVDNDFLFEIPDPALQVQIEVDYLDEGTDSFQLQYDADSGGPFGDGRYREVEAIHKTDSGEIKTAVFKLDNVFFGDRLGPADGPGDIRIFDNHDGAETFLGVIVRAPSAEQSFVKGDFAWHTEDFERAIRFYTHAMEAGFEDVQWAHNMRGLMYRETGQWDLCIEDYNVFFEMDPENPWASLERGECYAGQGNIQMARQDYERFLAFSEGDPFFDEIRVDIQNWLDQNP